MVTGVRLAVVGATGAVGRTIVRLLEERNVPVSSLGLFASRAHEHGIEFAGRTYPVHPVTAEALAAYDAVVFASSEDAGLSYAPSLVERGVVVVDNSAAFRLRDDVPLVVPGINDAALMPGVRLFPVANCTAIILSAALKPLRDAAGLRSVTVASYQAASGAGRAGLDELESGERALAEGRQDPPARVFAAPLARNVVPLVGEPDAEGWTVEERKVCAETRKILALPDLWIAATCVRVPVRTAHALAIVAETERRVASDDLAGCYRSAGHVVFHETGIVTPRDVEGTDLVHVARLRSVDDSGRHFALWAVGDQLRAGAAAPAVQLLERVLWAAEIGT